MKNQILIKGIILSILILLIHISKVNAYYTFKYPLEEKLLSKSKVRGIHVTSWVASCENKFRKIINLIRETELNAVVIDIKEVDGIIVYEADVELAKEIKATRKRVDIDKIISLCNKYNIYKIARICVFKDHKLASSKSQFAIKNKKNNNLWRDYKGYYWTNPYSKEVWEYNIAIAKDAIKRGFDEIQFDYLRFPTDGKISDCYYGKNANKDKTWVIIEFLKLAKQKIKKATPYPVFLSIATFGLTTQPNNDVGIGQKFKELIKYVDFICPMVYPSHYRKGAYGIKNPNAKPYKIVYLALKDAKSQIEPTEYCKIRPWLQDFSLGYPPYKAKEVRAQIGAVYTNNLNEWLLWNPQCNYTKSALLLEALPDEGFLAKK